MSISDKIQLLIIAVSDMCISDKIQLLGIVVSTLTSLIAIIISVRTLKQNSKMIEDSSRPYIGIYGMSTYICNRHYYIIIKNFGQSVAHIKSLSYDFDLAKLSLHDRFDPFGNIDGASIAPGQSYRCAIDFDKVSKDELSVINFHIKYSSNTRDYEDEISLKIDGNLGNLEAHQTSKNTPVLDVISETLQDMHIKSL